MALYFAWIGFYNTMLLPAALVGSIVFLYGVCTNYMDEYNVERFDGILFKSVLPTRIAVASCSGRLSRLPQWFLHHLSG
jgi:hypothetical protein